MCCCALAGATQWRHIYSVDRGEEIRLSPCGYERAARTICADVGGPEREWLHIAYIFWAAWRADYAIEKAANEARQQGYDEGLRSKEAAMTQPLDDTALEAAARRLCALRGWNPDERVSHGADPDANGMVPMVLLISARWERVARELRGYDLALCALGFARTTTKEGER